MTTAGTTPALESHSFEADIAKLMLHSVYSGQDEMLLYLAMSRILPRCLTRKQER